MAINNRRQRLNDSGAFSNGQRTPSAHDVTTFMISTPALKPEAQQQMQQEIPGAQINADGTIKVGEFILTAVGIRYIGVDAIQLPKEWELLGKHLVHLTTSLQWLIADWVAFGCIRYQETYEQTAAKLGKWSAKTLTNWSSVAHRVDVSRRRDTLTFSHHAPVAKLPPDWQDYWLDRAEEWHWSSRELQTFMNEYPAGLPESFNFSRQQIAANTTPAIRFGGEVKMFQRRAMKIASNADEEDRKKMADELRKLAKKIERGS